LDELDGIRTVELADEVEGRRAHPVVLTGQPAPRHGERRAEAEDAKGIEG
jgi:hypothetical protein